MDINRVYTSPTLDYKVLKTTLISLLSFIQAYTVLKTTFSLTLLVIFARLHKNGDTPVLQARAKAGMMILRS